MAHQLRLRPLERPRRSRAHPPRRRALEPPHDRVPLGHAGTGRRIWRREFAHQRRSLRRARRPAAGRRVLLRPSDVDDGDPGGRQDAVLRQSLLPRHELERRRALRGGLRAHPRPAARLLDLQRAARALQGQARAARRLRARRPRRAEGRRSVLPRRRSGALLDPHPRPHGHRGGRAARIARLPRPARLCRRHAARGRVRPQDRNASRLARRARAPRHAGLPDGVRLDRRRRHVAAARGPRHAGALRRPIARAGVERGHGRARLLRSRLPHEEGRRGGLLAHRCGRPSRGRLRRLRRRLAPFRRIRADRPLPARAGRPSRRRPARRPPPAHGLGRGGDPAARPASAVPDRERSRRPRRARPRRPPAARPLAALPRNRTASRGAAAPADAARPVRRAAGETADGRVLGRRARRRSARRPPCDVRAARRRRLGRPALRAALARHDRGDAARVAGRFGRTRA